MPNRRLQRRLFESGRIVTVTLLLYIFFASMAPPAVPGCVIFFCCGGRYAQR